jgi:ABC-type multidrug transport system fused ATPase/permease subunit
MTIIYFFRRVISFFWNKDKNIRLMIILSLSFGLIAVALNLCIPISLRYIINFLSSNVDSTLTFSSFLLIASYGLIWTLAQISLTVRSVFLFKPMQRASRKVTLAFFRHLLSLPLRFHLDRKTGSLLGNIEQTYISMSTLINILILKQFPRTILQ